MVVVNYPFLIALLMTAVSGSLKTGLIGMIPNVAPELAGGESWNLRAFLRT